MSASEQPQPPASDETASAPAPAEPQRREGATWGAALAAFAAAALLVGGAALIGGERLTAKVAPQPIAFNHQKHVKELGLECSACHAFYEKDSFSGLPSAEVCATCHAQAQGQSAEEARLVALLEAGQPLQWTPLFRQPAHVYYSHRRHVGAAQLACARCHGAIGDSTAPPERVRKLRMQDCLDCHRQKGAAVHCTACHR